MALNKLRVVGTVRFFDTECRCCGSDALCQHADIDLGGPVCRSCKDEVRSAELVLLAAGMAQPPLDAKGRVNIKR